MQLFADREPLDGGDLLLRDRAESGDARPLGFSVYQHGAGAALSLAAAVLTSGQIEMFTQDGKQTGLRIGVDRVRVSVDCQMNRSHVRNSKGSRSDVRICFGNDIPECGAESGMSGRFGSLRRIPARQSDGSGNSKSSSLRGIFSKFWM